MFRLFHAIEDGVILVVGIIEETRLTGINTYLKRLLRPRTVTQENVRVTNDGEVWPGFLMPGSENGNAVAPVAFVQHEDAGFPDTELTVFESAAAPHITVVAGIARSHGRRSHLKIAQYRHITGKWFHLTHLLTAAAPQCAGLPAAASLHGSPSGSRSVPTTRCTAQFGRRG